MANTAADNRRQHALIGTRNPADETVATRSRANQPCLRRTLGRDLVHRIPAAPQPGRLIATIICSLTDLCLFPRIHRQWPLSIGNSSAIVRAVIDVSHGAFSQLSSVFCASHCASHSHLSPRLRTSRRCKTCTTPAMPDTLTHVFVVPTFTSCFRSSHRDMVPRFPGEWARDLCGGAVWIPENTIRPRDEGSHWISRDALRPERLIFWILVYSTVHPRRAHTTCTTVAAHAV